MAEINKEITVDAPLDKIFDYVRKPSNLPEIWPSLVQITNEILLPNGGYSFQWLYKMSGIILKGTGEHTDIVPGQWLTVKTKGAIEITITFTFRSMEKQTRVTLTIEYRAPLPLLNRLGSKIIEEMNDQEADLILANLRARFVDSVRI
jgi:uncharacterized membrane protein